MLEDYLNDAKYKIMDARERQERYARYTPAKAKDMPWRDPVTEAEIKFAKRTKNYYVIGSLVAVAIALLMFLLVFFNPGIKNWIPILIILGMFVVFTGYFLVMALRIPLKICEGYVIATKAVQHSSGKSNSYVYHASVYFDYPTPIQVGNIAISKELYGKLGEGQKLYIANGNTPRGAVDLE